MSVRVQVRDWQSQIGRSGGKCRISTAGQRAPRVLLLTTMPPSEDDISDGVQARLAWKSFLDPRIPPAGHLLPPGTTQKLDDELQLLNEFAALAKRRRNAHVSQLYRLPPEVLSMILLELKRAWTIAKARHSEEEELEHSNYSSDSENALPIWLLRSIGCDRDGFHWIHVTYVCSMLRKVVSCSLLFSITILTSLP